MTIYVDWGQKIIHVARADMVQVQTVPTPIYQLDLDYFRLTLKDLEDDADGMAFLDTHRHNTTVEVGGAILARVVEIINGYTVTFEDGQYAVNLVGANSNVGDVVNVNQVSVRSSNSAGLQDLNSLQAASFDGEVALKISSTYSGTLFPVGTRGYPVNNLADAHTIAAERGINTITIMESMTLNSGEVMNDGYVFKADSPVAITLTIDPSVDITNAEFRNATITGTLDGNNVFRDCVIDDITFFNGFLHECALAGTITLGGEVQANMFSCYSGIAGGGVGQYATIDFNGNESNSLALRDYYGGIYIKNATHASSVASLDMSSGRVIFENTVTEGNYWVRGIADVTDGSAGNATVFDQTNKKETAQEVIPHVWAAAE